MIVRSTEEVIFRQKAKQTIPATTWYIFNLQEDSTKELRRDENTERRLRIIYEGGKALPFTEHAYYQKRLLHPPFNSASSPTPAGVTSPPPVASFLLLAFTRLASLTLGPIRDTVIPPGSTYERYITSLMSSSPTTPIGWLFLSGPSISALDNGPHDFILLSYTTITDYEEDSAAFPSAVRQAPHTPQFADLNVMLVQWEGDIAQHIATGQVVAKEWEAAGWEERWIWLG